MKKRALAIFVLVALLIGLCGTVVSAATPGSYQVGYDKVDITPYYDDAAREALAAHKESLETAAKTAQAKVDTCTQDLANAAEEEKATAQEALTKAEAALKTAQDNLTAFNEAYSAHFADIQPGDVLPVPLRGNSHETKRLALRSKQDDNGDGLAGDGDGIYATCISITDPNGETVILMSTDLIGMNASIANMARGIIFRATGITGDRVMINGSHSHHGVGIGTVSGLNSASNVVHQKWLNDLADILAQCAIRAYNERSEATMSKGSIEAEEALVAKAEHPVGDTLNAIRKENFAEGKGTDTPNPVTVLVNELPAGAVDAGTDSEGHAKGTLTEIWKDKNGNEIPTTITYVATPEYFYHRVYNSVRHYDERINLVKTEEIWSNNSRSNYYRYDFAEYGETGYDLTEQARLGGFAIGNYVPDPDKLVTRYVAGDNFNSKLDETAYEIQKWTWVTKDGTKVADGFALPSGAYELGGCWYNGQRIYRSADIHVNSVNSITEVDDTLLVLRFDFKDSTKLPVLLINWRAHTNKNRKSSVDYKADTTRDVGFYDSFFQVSADWINAFRYTLEEAGFRVAYFNGAAGNVNTGSQVDALSGWANYAPVQKTADGKVVKGTGEGSLEGEMLEDVSHAKNAGAIYGTELAEVALELINGENPDYQMTEITPKAGDAGIRSLQITHQTEKREVGIVEFLAAGFHRARDLKDGVPNNLSSTTNYPVCYFLDANGKPIVDLDGAASMYNEDGTFAFKRIEGKTTETETYTIDDVLNAGYTEPVGDVIKSSFTIASYLHANNAISKYKSTNATEVELNAIMLCDEIAFITGPGEFYDRYSSKATWDPVNGLLNGDDNDWLKLWGDTYGEPFFIGYCNASPGYMPSNVTYTYSKGVEGRALGSYETQTTNYVQGTGEKVIAKFEWMLDTLQSDISVSFDTENRQCQQCGKLQNWIPLSQWQAQSVSLPTGHYYLDKDMECATVAITGGSNVCLDLNGHTLTGDTRALTLANGATLSLQDSSEAKTGALVGQGFTGSASYGGTVHVGAGATLNMHGGALRFVHDAEKLVPTNGGVLYLEGTLNLYDGTIEGGQCSNAGGTIYSRDNSALNLYGGTILTGTTSNKNVKATACTRIRGTVLLTGDASVDNLHMWPDSNVRDMYSILTVKDAFTGTAEITFRGATAADLIAGKVIGISDNADLSKGALTVTGAKLKPSVLGKDLVLGKVHTHYCEACGADQIWASLPEHLESNKSLSTGHYYVDQDAYTLPVQTIASGKTVCVDLWGSTVKGSENAFVVDNGGKLSIQDGATGGSLAGQGFNKIALGSGTANERGATGGTVSVAAGGILNLYSGTLTYAHANAYYPGNGGIVNVEGTFNMYGGTVENGYSKWAGGNIYIGYSGKASFNMYGGTVGKHQSAAYGGNIAARGYVRLANNAKLDSITLWPATDKEGHVPLSELLIIQGTYTGSAKLSVSGAQDGTDIGTSEDANLTQANIQTSTGNLVPVVSGTDLILGITNAAYTENANGEKVYFSELQDAVSACAENGTVYLQKNVTGNISVPVTMTLELNGCSIDGKVTVASGKTLYCMDSATADYDITDGVYGRIKTLEGTVEGVQPVGKDSELGVAGNDVFMMITEADGTSFHAVGLNIHSMALRPEEVGVYYKNNFRGDSMVAEKVKYFGVALSIVEEPNSDNIGTTSKYTRFEKQLFGAGENVTSSLLYGIMRADQSSLLNRRNASYQIYGKAYIYTTDGNYVFGCLRSLSLQGMVEKYDAQYTASGVPENMLDMYATYQMEMENWNISNIRNAAK